MSEKGGGQAPWTMKLTDIPIGSWDLQGNWFPNLNLLPEMSVAAQRRHNMIGGHFNRPRPCDLRGIIVAYESPKPKGRVATLFSLFLSTFSS